MDATKKIAALFTLIRVLDGKIDSELKKGEKADFSKICRYEHGGSYAMEAINNYSSLEIAVSLHISKRGL